MRVLKTLLVCAVVLGASACVSTNATMLAGSSMGAALAPTDPASIAIYRVANQVPGAYRELALLNSSGGSLVSNMSHTMFHPRLRQEKIGDGVLQPTSDSGRPAHQPTA